MNTKCYFFVIPVLVISVVFCACTGNTADKTTASKQGSSSDDNGNSDIMIVVSRGYDEEYDPSVISDCRELNCSFINDDPPYYVIEEWRMNAMKDAANKSERSKLEYEAICKNYGTLETVDQVKTAAVEAFINIFHEENCTADHIKVYCDNELDLWIVNKLEDWMINGQVSIYEPPWIVFDHKGNLKNCWR